jgi:hypothetical protein
MKTMTLGTLKRWTTFALATVAVATLTPARPAHAADQLPYLKGLVFQMNFKPDHAGQDKFVVTWQDNAGHFIAEVKHNGQSAIAGGRVEAELGIGTGFKFTLGYTLPSGTHCSYEGAYRQWGLGPWSNADTDALATGVLRTSRPGSNLPVFSGPLPFCVTAHYDAVPE